MFRPSAVRFVKREYPKHIEVKTHPNNSRYAIHLDFSKDSVSHISNARSLLAQRIPSEIRRPTDHPPYNDAVPTSQLFKNLPRDLARSYKNALASVAARKGAFSIDASELKVQQKADSPTSYTFAFELEREAVNALRNEVYQEMKKNITTTHLRTQQGRAFRKRMEKKLQQDNYDLYCSIATEDKLSEEQAKEILEELRGKHPDLAKSTKLVAEGFQLEKKRPRNTPGDEKTTNYAFSG